LFGRYRLFAGRTLHWLLWPGIVNKPIYLATSPLAFCPIPAVKPDNPVTDKVLNKLYGVTAVHTVQRNNKIVQSEDHTATNNLPHPGASAVLVWFCALHAWFSAHRFPRFLVYEG
jgi:hypothetical protein